MDSITSDGPAVMGRRLPRNHSMGMPYKDQRLMQALLIGTYVPLIIALPILQDAESMLDTVSHADVELAGKVRS